MKNLKNTKEKGITLIALVVTITVLIILATVSINTVLGDNGTIKRAQKARDSYQNSSTSEDEHMKQLANEMAEYDEDNTTKNPIAGTTVAKPGNWTSSQVTPIADGNGGTVPLPNGFHYVGGDISTGLVISDKQGDTMTASGVNMGNQFVWIPVSSEDDLTRTMFDSNGQATTEEPTDAETKVKDCLEPYASGYATEASEYNTMKTQVLKYGGFYIGRYEAGVNDTTLRTKIITNKTVVCKKGVAPYNWIPWGKAINDVDTAFVPSYDNADKVSTNGAVYLAKNMYSVSNSVTSTVTYGCQWDAMCRYIGDSQRTITNTKDALGLTGSDSTDVSKNIYDLAGSCEELTMEANEYTTNSNSKFYYRIERGGHYKFDYSIKSRSEALPDSCYNSTSFRPTLYIK